MRLNIRNSSQAWWEALLPRHSGMEGCLPGLASCGDRLRIAALSPNIFWQKAGTQQQLPQDGVPRPLSSTSGAGLAKKAPRVMA
jgi:hypothetical protein